MRHAANVLLRPCLDEQVSSEPSALPMVVAPDVANGDSDAVEDSGPAAIVEIPAGRCPARARGLRVWSGFEHVLVK